MLTDRNTPQLTQSFLAEVIVNHTASITVPLADRQMDAFNLFPILHSAVVVAYVREQELEDEITRLLEHIKRMGDVRRFFSQQNDELDAELVIAKGKLETIRTAVEGPHPANSGLDSYTLAHISYVMDQA